MARSELSPPASHNVLVTSLDGDLPDLSNVPFRIERSDTAGNTSSFYIPGADYQSLELYSSGHNWTHGAQTYIAGDVELHGGTLRTLMNGDYAAGVEQTEIGFYIRNQGRAQRVYLQGHALTTDRGVKLYAATNTNYDSITEFHVQGGTLDIGGDLIYEAGVGVTGGGNETRRLGLFGDADTVITIHGNFTSNTRSPDTGNHLSLSTLNIVDGTETAPNRIEVAADPADTLKGGTYGIGIFNVGAGAATAHVQLVNNHLNDAVSKDKEDEILLVGTLNINAGSTLDLNGHGVKVGSTLSIDSSSWLDLNTNLTLAFHQRVDTFVGLGDQTAAWAVVQERVKDSTNPGVTFEPMLDSGGDTYWMAIPEPASAALLALGCAFFVRRRRSR